MPPSPSAAHALVSHLAHMRNDQVQPLHHRIAVFLSHDCPLTPPPLPSSPACVPLQLSLQLAPSPLAATCASSKLLLVQVPAFASQLQLHVTHPSLQTHSGTLQLRRPATSRTACASGCATAKPIFLRASAALCRRCLPATTRTFYSTAQARLHLLPPFPSPLTPCFRRRAHLLRPGCARTVDKAHAQAHASSA